jgi:16S rRNA (guanine1207-N2)-methyltransferase
VIAQALRAVRLEGEVTVFAPKDKGGSRLPQDPWRPLAARFLKMPDGTTVSARLGDGRRACRSWTSLGRRLPRRLNDTGLWTQPGVFSWDRLDRGTELLLEDPARIARARRRSWAGIGLLALKALKGEAIGIGAG